LANEAKIIKQGNTGTLYKVGVVGDPDLSVGGPDYTCTLAVPSAVPPISRATTTLLDNNTRFGVQLTPAETLTLEPGRTHILAVEINNTFLTPAFKVETHIEFYVAPQLIA